MIKYQQGATLFIALMLLTALSIIALSSAKMASLSMKIASNEQQRMRLEQFAQSLLKRFVTTKQMDYWLSQQSTQPTKQPSKVLTRPLQIESETPLMPLTPHYQGDFSVYPTIIKIGNTYPCIASDSYSTSLVQNNNTCCQRYHFSIRVSYRYQSIVTQSHQIIEKETTQSCSNR